MATSAPRLTITLIVGTAVAALLTAIPAPASAHRIMAVTQPGGLTQFQENALETNRKLTPAAARDAKPLEVVKKNAPKSAKRGPTGPAGVVPAAAAATPAGKSLAALDDIEFPINVGKIFIYKEATDEWVYCSGTVLTSQFKNVVATAGHCIVDPATGQVYEHWAFIPGYNDGLLKWPYGSWSPYIGWVFEDWAVFGDPDSDYGFVNVSKLDSQTGQPSGARIGDFVGGNGLAWNQGIDKTGYVFGYPHHGHLDGDKPYSGWTMKWCYGTIGQLAPYQGADAHVGWGPPINDQICSFTPGADGSPFLWSYNTGGDDPMSRVGNLNSVISRVRDTDGNNRYDTWTGPYFDGYTKQLYDLANARWSP
ncbi:hypothetical protein GCM10009555_036600 [Acrocarpospora macrocephala]|uniref:Peptidase n=1 Tax=Acrocarpospora macrocephala TaxID=150177 RepID=A0A5M3X0S7_9ACTN|nr:hypothetical protein [Acrocarpospora macrocephala]GES13221.1 hypothetical protein Amac_068180 [Acrocarpospora macrocephala]